MSVLEPGHAVRRQRDEQPQRRGRQDNSCGRGGERDQQALPQQARNHSGSRGAEREPDRDLAGAGGPPGEDEMGNVGARDDQDEQCSGEDEPNRESRGTEDPRLQRLDPDGQRAPARGGRGQEGGGHALGLRPGGGDSHAGPEMRNRRTQLCAGQRKQRHHEGHVISGQRPQRRESADDLIPLVDVSGPDEVDVMPDRRRRRPEQPDSQAVGDDDR